MPSKSRNFSCTLAVLLLLISVTRAIDVTPNSLCAPLCDNEYFSDPSVDNSWTLSPDVPCDDWEIVGSDSTIRGRKWKNCLSCELTSNATDAKTRQNDVYWTLFNFKFTLNWCVFGIDKNPNITAANDKCSEICAGPGQSAKIAMSDRVLETNQTLQYLYCNGPDIENILDGCAACLDKVPSAKALSQYAEVLKEGCVQKPKVGETLKIDFDLFPTAATRISSTTSAPARTETVTKTVAVTSATSSPTPTTAASSHDQAVRVGVGVGVGVGGALAMTLAICLILCRRRHRSAQRKEASEPDARAFAQGWSEPSHAAIAELNPNGDNQAPSELGGYATVQQPFEVDAGRPRNEMVHMLDSRTVVAEKKPKDRRQRPRRLLLY